MGEQGTEGTFPGSKVKKTYFLEIFSREGKTHLGEGGGLRIR